MSKADTSIKITKTLAEEIDKLIQVIPGYLNRSEFAREAIRMRLQEVKEQRGISGELSR